MGQERIDLPAGNQTGHSSEKGCPIKMDFSRPEERQRWAALERLLKVARKDTGQARRVANFLLAWHNAEENGGWDPTDLWNVDDAIAADMLTALHFIRDAHCYPDKLGLAEEITTVWNLWRGGRAAAPEPR